MGEDKGVKRCSCDSSRLRWKRKESKLLNTALMKEEMMIKLIDLEGGHEIFGKICYSRSITRVSMENPNTLRQI